MVDKLLISILCLNLGRYKNYISTLRVRATVGSAPSGWLWPCSTVSVPFLLRTCTTPRRTSRSAYLKMRIRLTLIFTDYKLIISFIIFNVVGH